MVRQTSATLAIKSGLVAAGAQFLLFLVLLGKAVRPDFDVSGALSILFLLGLAGVAFAGFWLLRRSPELGYFAPAVGAGGFLFIAGFLTASTVGVFVLPGAVAILLSGLMFLFSDEDRLPIGRRVLVLFIGLIWLLFVVAQVYSAGYLLNVPGFKGPAAKASETSSTVF